MIRFFVPGVPAPKGSARAYTYKRKGGGLGARVDHDCKRTRAWAAAVSSFASVEMAGRPPIEGPVAVRIIFGLPRPRSHYKASGDLKASAPMDHTSKPDTDKLLRASLDGLTGVVFEDDRQVAFSPVGKVYAPPGHEGAAICVEPLSDDARTLIARIYNERI